MPNHDHKLPERDKEKEAQAQARGEKFMSSIFAKEEPVVYGPEDATIVETTSQGGRKFKQYAPPSRYQETPKKDFEIISGSEKDRSVTKQAITKFKERYNDPKVRERLKRDQGLTDKDIDNLINHSISNTKIELFSDSKHGDAVTSPGIGGDIGVSVPKGESRNLTLDTVYHELEHTLGGVQEKHGEQINKLLPSIREINPNSQVRDVGYVKDNQETSSYFNQFRNAAGLSLEDGPREIYSILNKAKKSGKFPEWLKKNIWLQNLIIDKGGNIGDDETLKRASKALGTINRKVAFQGSRRDDDSRTA